MAGTPPTLERARARSSPRAASPRGRNQRRASPRGKTAPARITAVRNTAARSRRRRIPGAWTRLARITAVTTFLAAKTLAARILPARILPVRARLARTLLVGTPGARTTPPRPGRRSSRRWRRSPLTRLIGSMPPGWTRHCRTSSAQARHAPTPRAQALAKVPRAPVPRGRPKVPKVPKVPRAPVRRARKDSSDPRGRSGRWDLRAQGGHSPRECKERAPVSKAQVSSGMLVLAVASKGRVAVSVTAVRGTLRLSARWRVRLRRR